MAMEAVWDELSASQDGVESPEGHQDALRETEARAAAGMEELIDWEVAKRQLRKEFE